MRPRLLSLFCGAGGDSMGYYRAGFDVVGVDIAPQPRYPFEFMEADVLALSQSEWRKCLHIAGECLGFFDAIHASPPCQFFSVATPDNTRYSEHIDLITPLRPLLEATGLPYVIENVEGARKAMRDPVTICGSSLGLKVRRHRLFETNWSLMVPPCAHGQQGVPVGVYGEGSSSGQKRGRKADNEAEVLEVMGMPWADRKTATQAIPPAYTELIGHQLLQHLDAEGGRVTSEQYMALALAEMRKATWPPEKWCAAIQDGYAGHEYDWMVTHNFKAQQALWNAAHPAPVPPPPVVPPVTSSPFAGKGLFCTSEPAAVDGHPCDWVALQADPEGNTTRPSTSARIMFWQARADQWCADASNNTGTPYIGQAENQAELDKCLALHLTVPKALVGNAGSWTADGKARAAADGWDLIQEWYKNAHPWEASPDAANYPRFVNVCFGIYSEGEPGGHGYVQQIPLSDYRAVWHGSFSVWKAESMTAADWAVFAA